MPPGAKNIFEMPPHLFLGSYPFWAKLTMASKHNFLLYSFIFGHWNRPVWEPLYELIKQIQSGQVPLCTALVAPAQAASVLVPDFVSGGCLFVLERQGWGTNASPGASQVGGDVKPELPGVAVLPCCWLGLVWTAAPVCFLRGKLSLCNHWAFRSGGEYSWGQREWWHRSAEAWPDPPLLLLAYLFSLLIAWFKSHHIMFGPYAYVLGGAWRKLWALFLLIMQRISDLLTSV